MSLLRPRRLEPGQPIGLVAPSSAPNEPEDIRFVVETLASLGFRVQPDAHLFDRQGYFTGTDADRATDLDAMSATMASTRCGACAAVTAPPASCRCSTTSARGGRRGR